MPLYRDGTTATATVIDKKFKNKNKILLNQKSIKYIKYFKMKNFNTILIGLLLFLSLVNYDYAKLSPFETSKSNILDILIILCCIVAIINSFSKATDKAKP